MCDIPQDLRRRNSDYGASQTTCLTEQHRVERAAEKSKEWNAKRLMLDGLKEKELEALLQHTLVASTPCRAEDDGAHTARRCCCFGDHQFAWHILARCAMIGTRALPAQIAVSWLLSDRSVDYAMEAA